MEEILKALSAGRITVAEAARLLKDGHLPGGPHARFDLPRASRTGLPEIVLGEGKSVENLDKILSALHRAHVGALVSRATPEQLRHLQRRAKQGWDLRIEPGPRMAVLLPDRLAHPLEGRTAAILSAGTADAAVAEEVRFLLEHLGAKVVTAFDVGVAGLHRLARALPDLAKEQPGVYIVCAGREGALATLVAGLVDRPVIGVPTSQGYGRGGKGEAALTSMLQSCAPLAVVNIDAGVPAALVAAQFLRRLPASPAGPRKVRTRRGRYRAQR